MAESTAQIYYRLGTELEFLRGISSKSLTAPTSLSTFRNLTENLAVQRYTVRRVVQVLDSVLSALERLQLAQAVEAAKSWRPMADEMREYLRKSEKPDTAVLQDPFADQLVAIARHVAAKLEADLAQRSN